jgi:hypothetical protein
MVWPSKLRTVSENKITFGRIRDELKRVVGKFTSIATPYGLEGLGFRPRSGARIFAPVQISPGAHSASC